MLDFRHGIIHKTTSFQSFEETAQILFRLHSFGAIIAASLYYDNKNIQHKLAGSYEASLHLNKTLSDNIVHEASWQALTKSGFNHCRGLST